MGGAFGSGRHSLADNPLLCNNSLPYPPIRLMWCGRSFLDSVMALVLGRLSFFFSGPRKGCLWTCTLYVGFGGDGLEGGLGLQCIRMFGERCMVMNVRVKKRLLGLQ